jgi:DNA topoisomerase-2
MSKAIEEKYKVLDHISHVLLRPQTYLGSNKLSKTNKWCYSEENNKMEFKEMEFIPSFLKIFDEIIMNSVDESKREGTKLDTIKITISDNIIKIWDNGGVPVVIHKDHGIFLPEIIFGVLMSGSNYSDDEDRIVAGTNGLGVKLANIFSKEFTISTCDAKNHFYQVFSNNMRDRTEPTIKKSKKNHTEISYIPDYEKFKMEGLDETHFNLLKKRTVDIAACNPGIKIYFNEQLIKSNTFPDYVSLYTDGAFYESNKEKTWSIGIAASNEGFRQVSFVNSTETYDGGSHVDYILNQIISELRLFFQKKHKVDIKPSEIKNHIFLFLNTTVINPSFSSQTKEKLITEVKDFGFTYVVSAKLIKDILKSEIVETILDWISRKKDADANKLAREVNKNLAKIKVEKLIDAKGKNRQECSLCLFEGDSASSSFRSYRDDNTQGAFCLRGKFVNATDMTNAKLVENKEVLNFMAAMGLRLGEPADPSKLRYGKILIFTDADFDGFSINGLLINFLYKYWPELFINQMVYRVETPIVVSQNLKSKKKINFYTQDEYNKWLKTITPKEWIIKYKKGLAALSDDEYEEIILKPRTILILPDDYSSQSLNVWFGKDSELRKTELLKLQ